MPEMQSEVDYALRLFEQCLTKRDELLTGKAKLVLQTSLLRLFNRVLFSREHLNIILTERGRQLVNNFQNLIFNIPKLSLTQRHDESSLNEIDVTMFKKLIHLELKHISIQKIKEITQLKCQLQSLTCELCTEEEALCKKGKLQWTGLLKFTLVYCNGDNPTLNFMSSMPWLQYVNISHNNLTECDVLQQLNHLSSLNIRFNKFRKIPTLSDSSKRSLQYLYADHNFIQDLEGVDGLANLIGLDLSWNWLANKQITLSLIQLKNLQWINMNNNPFSMNAYYRLYLASSICSKQPEFEIDNVKLNKYEMSVFGSALLSRNKMVVSMLDTSSKERERIVQPNVMRVIKAKKKSKPRECLISEDESDPRKPFEENLDFIREPSEPTLSIIEPLLEKCPADKTNFDESKKTEIDELFENTVSFQIDKSQGELPFDQLPDDDNCRIVTSTTQAVLHEPKNEFFEDKSDINTELNDFPQVIEKSDSNEENVNKTCLVNPELDEVPSSETSTSGTIPYGVGIPNLLPSEITENNIDECAKESSSGSDSDDEILWQVQSYNKENDTFQVVFISLLESELKERSTATGQTLTKWPLRRVLNCTKTKSDPFTLELEFDVQNADERHRCYIMEYADAQTLIKRLYSVLEYRKDLTSTDSCINCSKQLEPKEAKGLCALCKTAKVNDAHNSLDYPVNQSPSSSSIVLEQRNVGVGTLSWTSPDSRSAASMDQPIKNEPAVLKKCESDIEIISNNSQSSIEVIDDHSRSQSTTPCRKKSSEERQTVAVPQLDTVIEIGSPLSALTESSSSGSLTESVVTAYESQNSVAKKPPKVESLAEESENSSSDYYDCSKEETLKELNDSLTVNVKADIYSYTDFKNVDNRIGFYLYNTLFCNDDEKLSLFVKCHIWKTGGSDFDGCFVISTKNIYVLSHSRTDFSQQQCDWLSCNESYKLSDIKKICPMIRSLGVEISINNFVFLLLLMDPEKTENLLNSFKELSLQKVKLLKNWSPKLDTALKQAMLNCENINQQSETPTVNYFTIFKSVSITKDEFNEETIRLGGLAITPEELYLLPGDLSWMTSLSPPIIESAQEISCLIEVIRNTQNSLALRFFVEEEAIEEVWTFTLTNSQIVAIISCIEGPWEKLYSVPLEITLKS